MRPVVPAIVLVLSCLGCSKEAPPAGEFVYDCIVDLARKSDMAPVTATVAHGNAHKAEALAWQAVCGKLPEPERENCRNEKIWEPQVSVTSSGEGGNKSHKVVITLERKTRKVHGRGASEADQASACRLAVEKACQQARAPGDCLDSGQFQKLSESTSRKRKGAGKK